jgi:hypothetical protein
METTRAVVDIYISNVCVFETGRAWLDTRFPVEMTSQALLFIIMYIVGVEISKHPVISDYLIQLISTFAKGICVRSYRRHCLAYMGQSQGQIAIANRATEFEKLCNFLQYKWEVITSPT